MIFVVAVGGDVDFGCFVGDGDGLIFPYFFDDFLLLLKVGVVMMRHQVYSIFAVAASGAVRFRCRVQLLTRGRFLCFSNLDPSLQ